MLATVILSIGLALTVSGHAAAEECNPRVVLRTGGVIDAESVRFDKGWTYVGLSEHAVIGFPDEVVSDVGHRCCLSSQGSRSPWQIKTLPRSAEATEHAKPGPDDLAPIAAGHSNALPTAPAEDGSHREWSVVAAVTRTHRLVDTKIRFRSARCFSPPGDRSLIVARGQPF
jgi:hypothetical protein